MTSSRRASLLVVLAQPGDEIFHGGILMHLSQQGVRVTLVCETNGEAGLARSLASILQCCWASTTPRAVSGSDTAMLER